MRRVVIGWILVCILLSACSPVATPTPVPSPTPIPTYTPYPTFTPLPTATPTNTPEPTATQSPTPEPTETPEPTATEEPKAGTRTNPIPFGETATLVRGERVYHGHIREVVSDRAHVKQMLLDANMFNKVPAEGYEGRLIYFVCEYVSGPEDEPGGMSGMEFDFLGGDGSFYREPIGTVEPHPAFGGTGFPGTTFEGWIYQAAAIADKPHLLVWKETWISSLGKGIYFALE